ncbi:uncharacterized protein LY79DRAFT_525681 [Colletotrichum navitas]|uniref:Uncharacterized protein n=1 Tax=Colletotrichum navitas TaxID=681940 RepID=A0AAD8UZC5_9PEZI|nr:uncharacterized protein LY79DRAFT_525681 [Colletotrichum navitas]KAK1573507.1 hypothetical protein LY79DRAFT_525681 [Colletotrichum navitas]
MLPPFDHTNHITDFGFGPGDPAHGDTGPWPQDPIARLRQYASSAEAWEATHPSHRGCFIGHACQVTGEASCPRANYLTQFHHAYGTCCQWSPGHIYCGGPTSAAERHLFPSCADCGVLVEIWDLILINRRLLVQTPEDYKLVQDSLRGYIRAYRMRRATHAAAVRARADDAFEAQLRCVEEGIETPTRTALMGKVATLVMGALTPSCWWTR